MPDSAITMSEHTIHNPAEPRHFMRLRPMTGRARALRDDTVLADASNAVHMIEVGKDVYAPLVYFPEVAIRARLRRNTKSTHCPLKGDAAYFDLLDETGAVAVENIAWTYPEPFDFATDLKGLIAFYPEHVIIETRGSERPSAFVIAAIYLPKTRPLAPAGAANRRFLSWPAATRRD